MVYSSRREKIVGGLTFFGLVVAVLLSYGNPDTNVDENKYNISAVFGRIDGLADEAEVRMGGVQIGRMVKADLDENYSAVVIMSIDKAIQLPTDTSAAIHTDGLFGSKFIELEPGGEEEMMVDGSVIDMAQSSVVVEELLDLIISEGKSKMAAKKQVVKE